MSQGTPGKNDNTARAFDWRKDSPNPGKFKRMSAVPGLHFQHSMFLLFPYQIEAFFPIRPIANWIIIGICVLLWVLGAAGKLSDEFIVSLVLYEWSPLDLIGHCFLHADFFHLLGNMVFLWVFGNAICSNTNNLVYPLLFLLFGAVAGAIELLFSPESGEDGVIGASGAVNGVIGFALAVYPKDKVEMFFLFFIKPSTFSVSLWVLVLFWLGFDLWGVLTHGSGIAYWAHMGGLATGLVTGMIFDRMDWVNVTEWDKGTILDLFSRRE